MVRDNKKMAAILESLLVKQDVDIIGNLVVDGVSIPDIIGTIQSDITTTTDSISALQASDTTTSGIVTGIQNDINDNIADITVLQSGVTGLTNDLSNHSSQSNGHGVSGQILGTTDIQSITNKTITSSSNTVTARRLGTSAGDVIIDTTSPAANQILLTTSSTSATWQNLPAETTFGKDYQIVEDSGLSSTTSSSWQTKLSMSTGNITGTYRVTWCCMYYNSAKSGEVRFYNDTDSEELGGIIGIRSYKTSDRHVLGRSHNIVFTGTSKSFSIQFRKVSSGTHYIRDASIEIWRVI